MATPNIRPADIAKAIAKAVLSTKPAYTWTSAPYRKLVVVDFSRQGVRHA